MPLRRDSTWFTMLLGALSMLPSLSMDMSLPGIPALEATFPDAAGHGPLTLSLFLAGFAFAPVTAGPLTDRFGRRPALLVALGIYVPSAALCALAPSFTALLACRLAQGLAAGACTMMPLAITRDVFVGNAARQRLSQITAVLGISPMVAPILGGWIMTFSDWRTIYTVQAISGLVLLLLFAVGLEETLPVARRRSLKPRQLAASYKMVFTDRTFCGFALFNGLGFAGLFAFVAASPAVFMGDLGLSGQVFSFLFAITACGQLLGSLISARLSRRHVTSRAILSTSFVATAVATIAALAFVLCDVVHTYTLMPFVAVVIFCFGVTAPNASHEALVGLPDVAGAAAGIMRCFQMFSAALASAALTLLEPLGQPALAMTAIMTGTILASGVIYGWLLRREAKTPNSVFRVQSSSS